MDQHITLTATPIRIDTQHEQLNSYSEISFHEASNLNERELRGSLLAMVELRSKTNETIDLKTIAQQTIDSIQKSYYINDPGSPLEILEEAVKKAENLQLPLKDKVLMRVTAIVVWGKTLLYSNPNNCAIGVRRNQEFFELEQTYAANLALKHQDLVICSNQAYQEKILVHALREEQDLSNSGFIDKMRESQGATDPNSPENLVCYYLNFNIYNVPAEEEVIEISYPSSSKKNKPAKPRKAINLPNPLKLIQRSKGSTTDKKSEPPIYIDDKTQRTPNSLKKSFIALTTLTLLATSIYISYRFNQNKQQDNLFVTTLSKISTRIGKADELSQLNPEQAHTEITQAREELGQVQGVRDENKSQVNDLYNQTFEIEKRIYKFLPINLNSVELDEESKQRVITLEGTQIRDYNQQVKIETDSPWATTARADTYADNIYVLDPINNSLWKYTALTKDSYITPPTNYIKESPNLDTAVDISIDGSVYVLFPEQLYKYSVGKKTDFQLHGLYPEFGKESSVATSPDAQFIFIGSKNGVLVFNKDGQYQRTLTSDLLTRSSIKEMVTSSDGKTLYLELNSSWYSINPLPE